jgi:hypothetical protein
LLEEDLDFLLSAKKHNLKKILLNMGRFEKFQEVSALVIYGQDQGKSF